MNEKQVESFLERGFNRRQIGRIATLSLAQPLWNSPWLVAEQQLRARAIRN